MKTSAGLFLLLSFVSSLAVDQPKPTTQDHTEDEAAIRQIVANWDRGWKDFDAEAATTDFAVDADWVNAFGKTRTGRDEIRKYLAALFLTPEIRSRHSTPSTVVIRFIRPDVAIVSCSRDTSGQKSASGREYPTRKTHDLRVIAKQADRWLVISHQIMDEKEVLP